MKAILYTGGMILLWGINLLNGTGLGAAYHSTEYARIAALVVALFLFCRDAYRKRGWYAPRRYLRIMLPMIAVFIAASLFYGYKWVSLDYLWVYLIVYILSHFAPDRKSLYLVGIAYAVLGLAILYIFDYMDALDGWNPNSIAMIGLFSYLVFAIPFYGARDKQSVFMLILIGFCYIFLIWPTNSRSCIVAIIFAILVVFRILPLDRVFVTPRRVFLVLQVPLLIAILGCVIALTTDVNALNAWSLEELSKPFFNGRDQAWLRAFKDIGDHLLFGTGYVDSGLYHNSAVACLIAYGAIGYLLWILSFHTILRDALPNRTDICVGGALATFLVIFWQQSVELGMFASSPNLIPYVILGIMLGRVRELKGN